MAKKKENPEKKDGPILKVEPIENGRYGDDQSFEVKEFRLTETADGKQALTLHSSIHICLPSAKEQVASRQKGFKYAKAVLAAIKAAKPKKVKK